MKPYRAPVLRTWLGRCLERRPLIASLAHAGESRSETIRRALRDAHLLRRRDVMRAESLAVAHDEHDLAEIAAVQSDLGDLHAW